MSRALFIVRSGLALFIFILLASCATGPRVNRTDAGSETDVSGRWNDTDARMVAEEMVADLMTYPWMKDFMMDNDRKPVVVIGTVRNKTSEHIDTGVFTKSMEKELLRSGRVTFVAGKQEREEVREEKEDQQVNADASTAARLAAETGADFMIYGTISSITDAAGGRKVIFYKVSMEMINIQNNEKVWINDKEIKKDITRSKYGS